MIEVVDDIFIYVKSVYIIDINICEDFKDEKT